LESKSAALVAAVFVDFPKNKCNFLHRNKFDFIRLVKFLTGRRSMRSFSPAAVATIARWKSAPMHSLTHSLTLLIGIYYGIVWDPREYDIEAVNVFASRQNADFAVEHGAAEELSQVSEFPQRRQLVDAHLASAVDEILDRDDVRRQSLPVHCA